jgi:hypothetical protein
MADHDSLIAELRALGDHLDVPAAADQGAAVRARLTAVPAGRRRWRGWLISAVAALAAAGAVGAIGPARAAVGHLLRVAGVEVRTDPRPTVLPSRPSPLPAERTESLVKARQDARFRVRVPAALGVPERVVVVDPDPAGAPRVVTMLYRAGRVRFDQFDGAWQLVFLKQEPDAQWTPVGADNGLWLPTPHPVTYVDRQGVEHTAAARLAGPTLIWSSGTVTYRLEGLATRDQAVAVARSQS